MAAASPRLALNSNGTSSERPCLTTAVEEASILTLLVTCKAFDTYLRIGGHAFDSVTTCVHGQKACDALVGNSIHHTLFDMLFSLELIASPCSVCKVRIMINSSLEATFQLKAQWVSAVRLPVPYSERRRTQSQIFCLYLSLSG